MAKKQQTSQHPDTTPVILAIGGSDTCGGAGIQADLYTARTFSVKCLTAVACLTSQTEHRFFRLWSVRPDIITSQINDMLAHYPVAAIKIGALGDEAAVAAVAAALGQTTAPCIIDPVLGSTAGGDFEGEPLIAAYRRHLLPGAWLVTPNRYELERFGGLPELFALGIQHVLVTGGDMHRPVDRLYTSGDLVQSFEYRRIPLQLHGTGCRLSTAITALCARGVPLAAAIAQAGDFVRSEIRSCGTMLHNEQLTK